MSTKKFLRRIIKRIIPLLILAWVYWPLPAFFLLTGLYDVFRQKNKNKRAVFTQYFLVNGTLAWLFSPLNTLIDILCLPFINKQVYTLNQLPKIHQEEITTILEQCPKQQLNETLVDLNSKQERTMLFYKWYGHNVETNYPCELFHKPFNRILTIGVSSFKAQSKTSPHFGWLRTGIRVLINIDENVNENAYIDVNNHRHVWKTDGPLFIFDDTVLHQSFNLTDKTRNCLFIDVTRPSLFPILINSLVKFFGFLSKTIPGFTKLSKWKVAK
jgi:beta-hydroxylase